MKDGRYDFHFVALTHDHQGQVSLRGNLVEGGDAMHAVRGQLSRAGANLLASFEVFWKTPTNPWRSQPADGYTIKMFGTGTHTTFNVIGLGPLGLIVEFHGTWREPLQERPPSDGSVDKRPSSEGQER